MKNLKNLTDQLILDLDSEKLEDFNPDFLRFGGFGNLRTLIMLECENLDDSDDEEKFY